ncbi:hypothetical protein HDF23_003042 [Mucilaginibacter lappiensis]|uniref:DUF2971 domain-containing protein n=1 Tax=Mucilaginibacter lappiensis TaxID=354630 RepID=A0ABR6PKX2_9SPHI|nr:DUF2971 domain-containing protein [Mucilaginibacter lappiensis]MBB6110286.1 hypothetical protein [Mucilaginibacter lappiensis]
MVKEKEVFITLRTEEANFGNAEKGLNDIFNSFNTAKTELTANGIIFNVDIKSQKFSAELVKRLTFYYFRPEKTKNRYVFKYVPVNLNLIKLLVNNELWFSDPRYFNDPFDTRYSIDADPKDEEILSFYYKEAQKLTGNEGLVLSDFIKTFHMPDKQQFLDDLEYHHYINTIASQYGICCFSEKHGDHLMWSHYADNTKGVCLVFDIKIIPEPNFYVFSGSKVKYRNAIIKKFYDGSPYMDTTEIIYSKYKNWKYEHEIRELSSFELGNANRTISFDPKCLTGIIFGPKTNSKDKETIRNLLSQLKKYQVEFMDSAIDLGSHSISVSKNRFGLK